MTVRAMSFGGGVQSTAMLVLAVTGRIENCTLGLFANVGDNAENPTTLDYVHDVAAPYAAEHGIELLELHRGGKHPDLYDRLTEPGSRFLGIPVRMASGAPGNRSCTHDYKMVVIGRELKARGASVDNPADVLVGISTDEIQRANKRRAEPFERMQYPLLDLGLSRLDCSRIITDAGLPVPPKSSCWFCPFHSVANWTTMRTDDPAMFERAAQLEETLTARRAELGKDAVFLSSRTIPLRRAIADLDALPFEDVDPGCDSGWCMT
jgi:3'-phosphoadenosine 5'-phosphosulfate sulfotransferase (PAPS reductase)/FAD synthetase